MTNNNELQYCMECHGWLMPGKTCKHQQEANREAILSAERIDVELAAIDIAQLRLALAMEQDKVARRDAFIDAVGVWLEGEEQEPCNDYDTISSVAGEFHDLKIQHLGNQAEGE